MGNELALQKDVDMTTWQAMRSQTEVLVQSGFLPKAVNTVEKALAIALKGRELGLPMMQSITSIHVIDGKPSISAELMAALVFQRLPGAVLQCIETSNTRATYEAGRPTQKILRMSFTIEDAQAAGVTGKDNWKKYPAAMLRARACSAICRVVFPDAIMGVYTPDELGAITTEEGDVIDATPTPASKKDSVRPITYNEPQANLTAKESLNKEIMEYCGGDIEAATTLLKDLTIFEKDGKESFVKLANIEKISDKWAGAALGKLRKHIKEHPVKGAAAPSGMERKIPANCPGDPQMCDESLFDEYAKALCNAKGNRGPCQHRPDETF